MVSGKGKEKVTDTSGKGKRKWSSGGGDDKTGRKRKNRGVLQFFDDAAYQVDEDEDSSDDSIFDDDDFLEEEFGSELKDNAPGKVPHLPFIPKEEEMSEEEFERMLEERYKPGSGFVTYAEDGFEHKKSMDSDIYVPSAKDPQIWKVKCMVGRERYSAFCLMQKYADMEYLGTKMQIISACALDHVKGFIFVEAEKQNDIYEACKGLSTIYSSRAAPVPNNEISRLLLVRSKSAGISKGMWARVKNGKYKGDIALVEAVNHDRKKVTVKLIPRIDLKAVAEKIGGGVRAKRNAIPAQRLISSSELDEFRPLIHVRRDRETNQIFEVLDGMMLKDGYLYKKIAIDSLSFSGATPTEDERLKFEPSQKNESTDVQWVSQLFGEKKKKEVKSAKQDKGGGKGEGSASTNVENEFEVHDLVFFGRKDFGVVIGSEKGEGVKVIKEGSEGPSVVTVKQSELRAACFDKKLFSVLDQHSNTLSVNDGVRVLDGPLKDRQGIIKKIYGGILFLCDEGEQENSGYICVKAQLCEKLNLAGNASNGKGIELGPSGFGDISSSPKSPLSPDKSWQEKDNKSSYKQDDSGMFSVGQSLRIRVGPLKGYLCRVLAVRRSDVTVKLDSQQKILTVKSEHLSEVRGRNSATAHGEDPGSVKPFDFLGSQDGATGWMDGTALSTEADAWNAGGSTERSSWSAFPSSNFSLSKESGSGDPVDDDAKKGDSSWEIKATPSDNSSWGAAAAKISSETGSLDGWGKAVEVQEDKSGQTLKDDSWGRAAEKWSVGDDASGSKAAWGSVKAGGDLDQPETSAWKKDSVVGEDGTDKGQIDSWNKPKSVGADSGGESSWGKPPGTSSFNKQDCGSSWGKSAAGDSSWGQQTDASAEGEKKGWNNQSDRSSWGNQDGGSSWSKPYDSGRGSGGRRGRGRGGGRGRSFDQQGNSDNAGGGWGSDSGKKSSWSSDNAAAGGWGSDSGKKSSWSSDNAAAGGWGSDSGKKSSDNAAAAGGWGSDSGNKSSDNAAAVGWGRDSGKKSSDNAAAAGWGSASGKKSSDNTAAGGWGNAAIISDEGSKKSDEWDNLLANASGKDEKTTAWNQGSDAKKDGNGWGSSSSSGWGANKEAGNGQDSWGKEKKPTGETKNSSWGSANVDDNQSCDWGKKGNWGSSQKEGSSWNQNSGGSGKPWQGGSTSSGWGGQRSNWTNNESGENNGGGGRGWRGGFRGGRGGSDRGGFRGGRGGDRGGGFRGGRGRGGDWNNSGGDDYNNSWKNAGGGSSSWSSQAKGSSSWSQQPSSWNSAAGKNETGAGGWGSSSNAAATQVSPGWGSGEKTAVASGWGVSSPTKDKGASSDSAWGKAATTEVSTGWGTGKKEAASETSGPTKDGGSSDAWGKAAMTELSTGWGTGKKAEATGDQGGPSEGAFDSAWGKAEEATKSSWGSGGDNKGGGW